METFYSGSLKIEIEEDGVTHDLRERFKGAIHLSDGRCWTFSDLASGVGGTRWGLIEMAESALSFGAYYSTMNRGSDTPEWAPPGEVASAMEQEAFITPDPRPDGWPERSAAGETEEGGPEVYSGDLYTVFDSLETQERYGKIADEDFQRRQS